jgi:ABC-type amino acid transport substrate-binding protein
VFHEADSFGSESNNGSWSGMVAMVSSGIAHVGVESFSVTKERSEVVAFTDTLGFER